MSDPIKADCHTDYLPAFHTSGKRNVSSIRWIILHDEEAPTAKGSAAYFKSPNSGGSAHLCVDDDACYRCLLNQDIPWGSSSSFGANTHGFHIEQAGYAKWSAVIWNAHRRTLERAAYKTAFHCRKFGVPPVWVDAGDLPIRDGVTTHAEVSRASRRLDPGNASRYTHSDPGPFWPRRKFMALVMQYFEELRPKGT